MKNMSFAITTNQARAQVKNVTRRLGWWSLKPGDQVQQVVKGMGLRKGEKIEKIHVIVVRAAAAEPLFRLIEDAEYGRREVAREGFPCMKPDQFIDMFCKSHKGCTPETEVNRIYFSYVDPIPKCDSCGSQAWGISTDGIIRCQWCRREFLRAFPQFAQNI